MDQKDKIKPASSNADNSNAPGTYPKPAMPDVENNLSTGSAVQNIDQRAPFASDPLNQGSPIQQADEVETTVLELELGGTGTIIVGGILVDADYNPDLTGRKRIDKYDEMRKSDATCRLGLMAVKKPLLSAKWYIKHGEDEDDEGEKTTFVKDELFNNPNFPWTQFLNQVLLFCDFGNSFFEKVFRRRADGKTGWKKFAPRLPKTIYRYTLQDGITPGITQQLPTGGIIEIPQWKLLTFINELEGANYEGTSLLRAAYKHYYYKDLYYRIDAIASERQGMGVPIITVPPQATPKDKAKAKEIARNMRVNEQAYVDLPVGFEIKYIDTHAKELKEVKEMVMHHDRQILKAFLAHFLDMGASSAGSRNLSDDQSELFLVSLKYMGKIIQEQMNLAIKELIDLNFTGTKQKNYPTLELGGIGQVDFAQLAQAMNWLTTTGVIVPDTDLENYIRQTMDLPNAMDLKDQTPEEQQRRKIGFPTVTNPNDPENPNDQNNINNKTTTTKAKMTHGEASSFAQDLLGMKAEIEEAIRLKENAY